MSICGYIIAFPDEVDVIENPLVSMRPIVDEIFVFNAGWGPVDNPVFCHNPRKNLPPLSTVTDKYNAKLIDAPWPGNAGIQRNVALDYIGTRFEWVLALDCDEALEVKTQQRLIKLDNYVKLKEPFIGMSLMLMGLYPDERHYSKVQALTGVMAHPRLHRTGYWRFTNTWHEHFMIHNCGNVIIDRDMILFHMRPLWENRLIRQRGQTVAQAWVGSTEVAEISKDIIVPHIFYPDEDKPRASE